MGWYTRLKPPRSRAARERVARRNKRDVPLRDRKPIRVRNPDHIFYRTYSTDLWLNGYKAKVISRWGIAKFFDVEVTTVYRWHQLGVLPEPYVEQDRGQQTVSLYLSAQVRCLMIVVRDLVEDGYKSVPWQNLPDHMGMLHNGYDETFRKFKRRLSGDTYGGEDARRGVVFED